jgi:transposase-like protein
MMAERHLDVAHTTIMRWVQRYVPEFVKQWQPYDRSVGTSWRVDETYIKLKGKWVYLYRGVDKEGRAVDFFLSHRRDMTAAKQFLQQVGEKRGVPERITLDGYAASHEAVAELQDKGILPPSVSVRTNRYLNNLVEQDHRKVKQRVRPRLGFKRFEFATITVSGIEFVHQIKKDQFDVSALRSPSGMHAASLGRAVLAA